MTAVSLDHFTPELERLAYMGGTHGLEDLRLAVETGAIQVWPSVESIMLTKAVPND